jgi:RND family efflux transporter MFP subunit
MKNFKILYLLATTCLFYLTGCSRDSSVADQRKTIRIERGSIERVLESSGSVRTDESLLVSAEMDGKIETLHVSTSEYIKAGDLVATLDSSEGVIDVRKAQKELERAQVEFEEAKESGALKATLKKKQIEIEIAQIELERLQNKLSSYLIKSPGSGYIKSMLVKVGDRVVGKNAFFPGTKIAELSGSNIFRFTVSVSERDVSRVQVGMAVDVRIDSLRNLLLEGQIVEIGNATEQSFTRSTYPVTVEFHCSDKALKAGMTASMEGVLERANDVLYLPVSAVGVDGKESYVMKTKNSNKLSGDERVPITLGVSDGNIIEIRGDLKEGDEVILP